MSLLCHHQNDSCIKMGSDENHFNVSVGSDGQSHRTVSTDHNLFEEKGEPKRYRTEVLPLTNPNALPLGQTGSLMMMVFVTAFMMIIMPHSPSLPTIPQSLSLTLSKASAFSSTAHCPWRTSSVKPPNPTTSSVELVLSGVSFHRGYREIGHLIHSVTP